MSDEPGTDAEHGGESGAEGGVAESLRAAVERTMRATAGSAEATRERAAELVDEVARRGREARDQLTRRSQEAGVELARRGQEATGEMGRRLELLEQRLAELERSLGTGPEHAPTKPPAPPVDPAGSERSTDTNAKPEG